MSLGLDNLRCQILGGAAQRPRSILQLLGETKVGDLQVAVPVQQQILRLQVPVHDVQRVQVLQGQDNLAGIEVGCGRNRGANR